MAIFTALPSLLSRNPGQQLRALAITGTFVAWLLLVVAVPRASTPVLAFVWLGLALIANARWGSPPLIGSYAFCAQGRSPSIPIRKNHNPRRSPSRFKRSS